MGVKELAESSKALEVVSAGAEVGLTLIGLVVILKIAQAIIALI